MRGQHGTEAAKVLEGKWTANERGEASIHLQQRGSCRKNGTYLGLVWFVVEEVLYPQCDRNWDEEESRRGQGLQKHVNWTFKAVTDFSWRMIRTPIRPPLKLYARFSALNKTQLFQSEERITKKGIHFGRGYQSAPTFLPENGGVKGSCPH